MEVTTTELIVFTLLGVIACAFSHEGAERGRGAYFLIGACFLILDVIYIFNL